MNKVPVQKDMRYLLTCWVRLRIV